MLLLLEYLNLNLMKPFFSQKFRYPIMSRSDVLGTEMVEMLLAILEVI